MKSLLKIFLIKPSGDNAAFSKLIDHIKEKANDGVQVYHVVS